LFVFVILLSSKNIILVHGTRDDNFWGDCGESRIFYDESVGSGENIILCGHTHIQGIRFNGYSYNARESSVMINPGSVGQPRNGDPRAQFAICDDDFSYFSAMRVNYDIDTAANKIIKSGRPQFLANRLYLGI
jgi:diadenosine tetraphosphatase ApaH/serine/threonine PP2A family protein phosphatase